MNARALLLAVVLLSAGLAGCVGDDGSEDDGEFASTNETQPANETDDRPAEPRRTWTNETLEGEISGFNAVAVSGTMGDNLQTFSAESGIAVLYLNLTAEGGAVDMWIGGPDCDVSGNQIPGCADEASTSSGEASYVNETPAAGEWQVRLAVGDPVGAQVSYTLDVVQGLNATAER